MQHSIKSIGEDYQSLSEKRGDNPKFNAEDFFNFAKKFSNKYHVIENGDDLLVSSWFSSDLIDDYRKTLK